MQATDSLLQLPRPLTFYITKENQWIKNKSLKPHKASKTNLAI